MDSTVAIAATTAPDNFRDISVEINKVDDIMPATTAKMLPASTGEECYDRDDDNEEGNASPSMNKYVSSSAVVGAADQTASTALPENSRGSLVYEFPTFKPLLLPPNEQQQQQQPATNGDAIATSNGINGHHHNGYAIDEEHDEEDFVENGMNGDDHQNEIDDDDEVEDECSYCLLEARVETSTSSRNRPASGGNDAVYEDNLMPPSSKPEEATICQEGDEEGNYERLAVDKTGAVNGIVPETYQIESDGLDGGVGGEEDDYCMLNSQDAVVRDASNEPSSDYVDIVSAVAAEQAHDGNGDDDDDEVDGAYDDLRPAGHEVNGEEEAGLNGVISNDYETVIPTHESEENESSSLLLSGAASSVVKEEEEMFEPCPVPVVLPPAANDQPSFTTANNSDDHQQQFSSVISTTAEERRSCDEDEREKQEKLAPLPIAEGENYDGDGDYTLEEKPASAVLVQADTTVAAKTVEASSFSAITLQNGCLNRSESPSATTTTAASTTTLMEPEPDMLLLSSSSEFSIEPTSAASPPTTATPTEPMAEQSSPLSPSSPQFTADATVAPAVVDDDDDDDDDDDELIQLGSRDDGDDDVNQPPAQLKQRVTHNIDVIQNGTSAESNGCMPVVANGHQQDAVVESSHDEVFEAGEEEEEDEEEEEEEEVELTIARYPPREYYLQAYQRPDAQAPIRESLEEEHENDNLRNASLTASEMEANAEVVVSDTRAVKPEELEEVRRHGVAASLLRHWELSLSRSDIADHAPQTPPEQQQQVASGTAKSLRKMFESQQINGTSTMPPRTSSGSMSSLANRWRSKTPEDHHEPQQASRPKWNVLDPREVSRRLTHTPRANSHDERDSGANSSPVAADALDAGEDSAVGSSSSRGDTVCGDENNAGKTVFENTPVIRDDTVRGEDTTLSELEQLRQASATRNVRNVFQQLLATSGGVSPSQNKTPVSTPKRIVFNKFNATGRLPSPTTANGDAVDASSPTAEEEPKPAPGTARSMAKLFNNSPKPQTPSSSSSAQSQHNYRWRVDDPRERNRQLKQADVRSGEPIVSEDIRKPSLVVIQSQK